MSKHIFDAQAGAKFYTVQIGWDKPTVNYYYDICEVQGGVDVEPPVSSSMSDTDHVSLSHIIKQCSVFGITVPVGLIEAVKADRTSNTVNAITHYPATKA